MSAKKLFRLLLGTSFFLLGSAPVPAADAPGTLASPLLPPPAEGLDDGVTPFAHQQDLGETISKSDRGDGGTMTRPASTRRMADPDVGLTVQRRRWKSLGSDAGAQPYVWGWRGDVPANLSAGLQTDVLFTDNIGYEANELARGDTVLEISPILKLDVGDPQDAFYSTSRPSPHYASLLYVPTLHYLVNAGHTAWLHHLFTEAGRMTDVSRLSFRLDYDERVLTSSDDTSPEDAFTQLEASGLFEYRFTPKTLLRTKGAYRSVTVEDGTSDRTTWIAHVMAEWAASPKTTLGLGTEFGHIQFEQEGAGAQDYQQALLAFRWRPAPKVSIVTQTGVEMREFGGAQAKDRKISPLVAAAMQWQPTETTRLDTRIRVGNEPSIVEQGALFQETRLSAGALHDFSARWYASGEIQFVERDYDTGRRESEPGARLAVGFRENADRSANHLTVELYYQWRERRGGDTPTADRSQFGLQVTKFF